MSYESILYEVEDGVALLTINRPKVLNALDTAVLNEMEAALGEAKADPKVRCLVITGAGDKAFIAGADINELAVLDPMGAKDYAARGQNVMRAFETLTKPTVAMVNGFALGGGLETALACTLRTGSTKARVGLPEVSLGIIPGYGGTQRLARVAGPGVAREWILTADMYDAQEAHRVGVFNRVFEPAELKEGTMKMVHSILSRGPVAVRLSMELINRSQNMGQLEGEFTECNVFGLAASTADMKEGMSAFLEKRKPSFQGQ